MEFVGLRSKSYSFLFDDKTEKKTCKGVPKTVINKHLSFKKYKKCLFEQKQYRHEATHIGSQKQRLKTLVKRKVSLSAFDSKIQLKNCGLHGEIYGTFNPDYNCKKCIKRPV